MLVQYLVGLCCLRRDPEAIDVTIGDMVRDAVASKYRDVDVTVTIDDRNGRTAIKAYEVKHEKSAIDVTTVEGLCAKLNDMPQLAHRAIVSSSGYTDGARAKARGHGVDLYTLNKWDTPIEADFPGFGLVGNPSDVLQSGRSLLEWDDSTRLTLTMDPPSRSTDHISNSDQMYSDANSDAGVRHAHHETFGSYRDALLQRSTDVLYMLDPAQSVLNTFAQPILIGDFYGPAWPHTHTLETGGDGAFVQFDERLRQIVNVSINGRLCWHYINTAPDYFIMRSVETGPPFSSAMVALGQREGEMLVFAVADSPFAQVHNVALEPKHLNSIRKLQIEVPLWQPT